jgi:hypothetical protein
MRNRYLQAAICILRTEHFWALGIGATALIWLQFQYSRKPTGELETNAMLNASVFWPCMGIPIGKCMKEMLGGPQGRLMPGAHRPFLLLAISIGLLLASASTWPLLVDNSERWAYVAAWGFTTIGLGTWCGHMSHFVGGFLTVIAFVIVQFFGFQLPQTWPMAAIWLLIAVGIWWVLCSRVIHLHEELPEMQKWVPPMAKWQEKRGRAAASESLTMLLTRTSSMEQDFPTLRRPSTIGLESNLQRAFHWNVVWCSFRTALIFGGMLLMFGLLFTCLGTGDEIIPVGMSLPFLVLFPAAWIQQDILRHFSVEWMRPYSRAEYFRAVGLALLLACGCSWLVIAGASAIMTMIFAAGGGFPDGEPGIVKPLLLSTCVIPLIFGLAMHFGSQVGRNRLVLLLWGVAGTGLSTAWGYSFVHSSAQDWNAYSYRVVFAACMALLAAGCAALWWSYRGWMNYELSES